MTTSRHNRTSAIRLALTALVWACGLLYAPGLLAQTNPILAKAKQELVNQNHAAVIKLVRPLVEPKSLLASEADEALAYELLAISYWWLKKYKASEAAFMILLNMRPTYRVNPAIHPPGLVRFFNRIRKKLRIKPVEIRRRQSQELTLCRKKLRKDKALLGRLKKRCGIERIVVKRQLWPAFLPFGVGQFNNGDRAKGWVFFSVELALLLANATSYVLAETSWVRNGPSGTVRNDPESLKRARSVQAAQIASGVLLGATALAGIIEALISYRGPQVKTRRIRLDIQAAGMRFGLTPSGTLGLSLDLK